jgi:hypothetical protein
LPILDFPTPPQSVRTGGLPSMVYFPRYGLGVESTRAAIGATRPIGIKIILVITNGAIDDRTLVGAELRSPVESDIERVMV